MSFWFCISFLDLKLQIESLQKEMYSLFSISRYSTFMYFTFFSRQPLKMKLDAVRRFRFECKIIGPCGTSGHMWRKCRIHFTILRKLHFFRWGKMMTFSIDLNLFAHLKRNVGKKTMIRMYSCPWNQTTYCEVNK